MPSHYNNSSRGEVKYRFDVDFYQIFLQCQSLSIMMEVYQKLQFLENNLYLLISILSPV
uniref:Uncharacterized protein n=1 Tax=Arion vulgaris TaxID=1028688 RepID=A0A0B6Y625_9EUPU